MTGSDGAAIASREDATTDALRNVLNVAAGVLTDLDPEASTRRILAAARALTGARYAALATLGPTGDVERFTADGVSADVHAAIGPPPSGRGVLAELIGLDAPVLISDLAGHPQALGFPPNHPPMHGFLGVRLAAAGRLVGYLYLTEPDGRAEFDSTDAQALGYLAAIAANAVDHAHRYAGLATSRRELERTVAALEATMQISEALGGRTGLAGVLDLVAERGRELVGARALVIEYVNRGTLTVAAAAGEGAADLVGRTIDLHGSVASVAISTQHTQRLEDDANRERFEVHGLGRIGLHARTGLAVPLVYRGTAHGVLIALDRVGAEGPYPAADQRLLESFAASAAIAIATAESFAAEQRRERLAATEAERTRWARELHDETLQGLAALKLKLAGPLRRGDAAAIGTAAGEAVAELDRQIAGLRALIADLRPGALDELGLRAAVEDLAARARSAGLDVRVLGGLSLERDGEPVRLPAELEIAMYRIVQEALTNASRHGRARRATIRLSGAGDLVRVEVVDDGVGFELSSQPTGFGLAGMRERAELLAGSLAVVSAPGRGTRISASFPLASDAMSSGGRS